MRVDGITGAEDGADILLVGDAPDLAPDLAETLAAELARALGHDGTGVTFVPDAEGAVAAARGNRRLRLVIIDMGMAQVDGLDLLRRLREVRLDQRLSAIVVMGAGGFDRAVESLRLDAVDFVQKPLDAARLAAAVTRALALSSGADVPDCPPTPRPVTYLKALLALRLDRAALFPGHLFGDPAWDMMLDLALCEASGQAASVSNLCAASGAAHATALRRLADLEAKGMVERRQDEADRRRHWVRLTAAGSHAMADLLERQTRRLVDGGAGEPAPRT